jgi:hypothetical protein
MNISEFNDWFEKVKEEPTILRDLIGELLTLDYVKWSEFEIRPNYEFEDNRKRNRRVRK